VVSTDEGGSNSGLGIKDSKRTLINDLNTHRDYKQEDIAVYDSDGYQDAELVILTEEITDKEVKNLLSGDDRPDLNMSKNQYFQLAGFITRLALTEENEDYQFDDLTFNAETDVHKDVDLEGVEKEYLISWG